MSNDTLPYFNYPTTTPLSVVSAGQTTSATVLNPVAASAVSAASISGSVGSASGSVSGSGSGSGSASASNHSTPPTTSASTASTSHDLLKYSYSTSFSYSYPTNQPSNAHTRLPSISTLLTNPTSSNPNLNLNLNLSLSTSPNSPPVLRHTSLRSESFSSLDSFSRSNSIYNSMFHQQQQQQQQQQQAQQVQQHQHQHQHQLHQQYSSTYPINIPKAPHINSSTYSTSIFSNNNNSLDTLTNVATQSLSSKSSVSSTSFFDFNLPRQPSSDEDSGVLDNASSGASSPYSSSSLPNLNKSGKKKRSNLPKQSTNILFEWLHSNLDHPYPNSKEKIDLMRKTGLTSQQLSNWFINARRRKIQSLKEKKLSI